MKKSFFAKLAFITAGLAFPILATAAQSPDIPTGSEKFQAQTPGEREAVKQLLMDLQAATEKATDPFATIGDLRRSVTEISQINTFGCPTAVRESFMALTQTYSEYFAFLEKIFNEFGFDDSTLLQDAQKACDDPAIREEGLKMQNVLIAFVNSLIPYLSGTELGITEKPHHS